MHTSDSAENEYSIIKETVDGVRLKNMKSWASRYFNSSIVANNIYYLPACRQSICSWFLVLLEPLSSGNHEVRLKVCVLNPIKLTIILFESTRHLIEVRQNCTTFQAPYLKLDLSQFFSMLHRRPMAFKCRSHQLSDMQMVSEAGMLRNNN